MSENITVKLADVRLSFPALFEPKAFEPGATPKYAATFRLDKKQHAKEIKEIQKAVTTFLAENKVKSLGPDKIALKDGDESDREEDAGMFIIKASSNKRPLVLNRDKTPITDADNIVYPGCRVNAIISVWWQDHPKYGKRVNASLQGVMFNRDDEPFGSIGASADDFDDFSSEEDEEAGF